MSDPFLGEIRMFAGSFAPKSWALCNGQFMSPSQNDALFSLLGSIYGGDGRSSFALPDMQSRLPVHFGQGPGTSNYFIGQKAGTEAVTLTTQSIPGHNHPMQGAKNPADSIDPGGKIVAEETGDTFYIDYVQDRMKTFIDTAVADTGGNVAHKNLMPFLCITFIIALKGVFPSRN